jgi:hypothetical protein
VQTFENPPLPLHAEFGYQSQLEQSLPPLVSFPLIPQLSSRVEDFLPSTEQHAVGKPAALLAGLYSQPAGLSSGDHNYSVSGQPSQPDVYLPPGLDHFGKESFQYSPDSVVPHLNMAQNIRPPSRPPPPMSRPPPPMSRHSIQNTFPVGPPPSVPPPPVPASPANGRKLSLPSPPQAAMFKRPPEKMEDTKIIKFGDTKLRSPSPVRGASVSKTFAERKVSAPPAMNHSPLPYNMNGSSDMLNFMNLLEREESDFVDQVKKSKAFIQSVIRQACHSNVSSRNLAL